jgi:hypothetical protein
MRVKFNYSIAVIFFVTVTAYSVSAQTASIKKKYSNSLLYAGIEVGSKGVKLSIVEIGKNAKSQGAFNIVKDTSVNTDFISFTPATYFSTLSVFATFYHLALSEYKIPAKSIYTVVSSGVKMQADKEKRTRSVDSLIASFKYRINEPERKVTVIDVAEEARLSHLGIVPDEGRYNTFLVDIGSGNTKGGYFPSGNTKNFKLFQLNWGTKSVANATEKKCEEADKSLSNYNKQLFRVMAAAEQSDINYAINTSGAFALSDNIAFSGGISWAVATLILPEFADRSVIVVTFDEVQRFAERVYKDYASLSDINLTKDPKLTSIQKATIAKSVKNVHKVFDQRSLMAGTALLIKLMRQFASLYETKQFYLVKNGQVGWVSAFVDESLFN